MERRAWELGNMGVGSKGLEEKVVGTGRDWVLLGEKGVGTDRHGGWREGVGTDRRVGEKVVGTGRDWVLLGEKGVGTDRHGGWREGCGNWERLGVTGREGGGN